LWAVLGLSALGDWLGLLATSTFAAEQVSGSLAKGAAFGSVIAVRPAARARVRRGRRCAGRPVRPPLHDGVCDLIRFVFFLSIPAAALVTDSSALIVGWAAIATFAIESVSMLWTPPRKRRCRT
jgi:dTMP kinase